MGILDPQIEGNVINIIKITYLLLAPPYFIGNFAMNPILIWDTPITYLNVIPIWDVTRV